MLSPENSKTQWKVTGPGQFSIIHNKIYLIVILCYLILQMTRHLPSQRLHEKGKSELKLKVFDEKSYPEAKPDDMLDVEDIRDILMTKEDNVEENSTLGKDAFEIISKVDLYK